MRTERDPYEDPEDSQYSGIGMVGHAGPYFPYDIEDPNAPERAKGKRSPGFVTADDYVTRGGVVKQYKRKRKR